MTPLELAPRVLANTPPWVWAVLVLLIVLGVRRLKLRRTHAAVAALAPVVFIIWSVFGVVEAAREGATAPVLIVWLAAYVAGFLTALVHRGPQPTALGGGVFLFPATTTPLLLYMLVFWARYGLAVWAALEPERALTLALAATAISAGTAGRFTADFGPLLRTGHIAVRLG